MNDLAVILTEKFSHLSVDKDGLGWSLSNAVGKPLSEQLELLEWPKTLGPKPSLSDIENAGDEIDRSVSAKKAFEHSASSGFDTGMGFAIPVDDASRANLVQLRSHLVEGINFGVWQDNSPCPVGITSTDGSTHYVTVGEARRIIFNAGNDFISILETLRKGR